MPRRLSSRALLALALTALGLSRPVFAGQGGCEGAFRPDTPAEVGVEDLDSAAAAAYSRRAVRTRGQVELDVDPATRARRYRLRDGLHRILIEPCPAIAARFEDAALGGPRVEITGEFSEPVVRFWSFVDLAQLERPQRRPPGMPLAEALSAGPSPEGRTLRVVGQFGGRILLGDLPADSPPDATAWALRDGRRAVWVIGRRPEGDGWKLDPAYAPDTARWLEVEGRLEPCGQVTCLRARRVTLTRLPSS